MNAVSRRIARAVAALLLLALGGYLFSRPLTGATLAAAFLGIAQWTWGITWAPQILTAVALVVLVVLAVRSLHQPGEAACRIRLVAWAVLAAVLLGLEFVWPDAAVMLAGYAVALGCVVVGLGLAVRALSGRRLRAGDWMEWVALAAAGALLVAATVGTVAREEAVPRAGEFYSWSGALPDEPGTLLRFERYDGQVPDGSSGYRILYTTTYSDGSAAVASGVVIVPDGAAGSTVVAWQHGTTGVTQSCAPSLRSDQYTPENIAGLDLMMERGWVVVATDYPGQGTSGRYPYLVGEGEGRATLDAVRAAAQLEGLPSAQQVMLWGHSQGGHATLWAAQIADGYAPELPVVGVAALSAAQDPLALARAILTPDASSAAVIVAAYVLVPYADEYADVQLQDAVTSRAAVPLVQQMAQRCVDDPGMAVSVLAALAGGQRGQLVEVDLDQGVFASHLGDNAASGDFDAPLFLGQGVDDEVIPIELQRDFAAALEEQGRDVEVHEYAGYNHLGVITPDSPLIADLFAWADKVLES